MRLPRVLAAVLLAGLFQPSACTLTDDGFEPTPLVARVPSPEADGDDEDDDARPAESLPPVSLPDEPEPVAECSAPSELPGCVTPLDPAASACEGDDCDVGPPSCTDGTRNGGEGGVDCGGGCDTRCATDSTCSDDRDCLSQRCDDGRCSEPSCDDGVLSPEETDVDCGGACDARCGSGLGCATNDDCGAGLFCPETTQRCADVSCQDDVQNGSETDTDCGGECPGCPDGAPCALGSDCLSSVCADDGRCAPPACDDEVRNQNETAPDCGGSCAANCGTGQACGGGADCTSGVCGTAGCAAGAARCCQAPACNDGVRNGNEPVVDCGDARCGLCPLNRPCTQSAQCGSGFCSAGVCRTHPCEDGALNGTESDVDCGGGDPRCGRCDVGSACNGDGDCDGLPCVNGACFGCGNGLRDSNESDVDCGGACGACATGRTCGADADCQSGVCDDGRCCGGNGVDCTRCARRLAAATLSCEFSTDPVVAGSCNAFLDCLASHPVECSVRHAQFCSADPGGVCNHLSFGGNGSQGLVLADSILGTAACNF
jgi:hypothetical protein